MDGQAALQADVQRELVKIKEPALRDRRQREVEVMLTNLTHACTIAVQHVIRLGPFMEPAVAESVAPLHFDWFVAVVRTDAIRFFWGGVDFGIEISLLSTVLLCLRVSMSVVGVCQPIAQHVWCVPGLPFHAEPAEHLHLSHLPRVRPPSHDLEDCNGGISSHRLEAVFV